MDSLHALSAWVRCAETGPHARARLFCFSYAGGSASFFRTWPASLGPKIDVCAIQLPGRENRLREPPFIRLGALVPELVEALTPGASIPFALFGFSMGALICFELARELRRRKRPGPICLYVAAHRAPQLPDLAPPIHQLPDKEFLTELRRYRGISEEVLQNRELRHIVLPTLRADFAVCETYEYRTEAPLTCPIIVFGGLEDGEVKREDLQAWREQTNVSFSLRMLPGDHFFIRSAQPQLQQILMQDLYLHLNQLKANL